MTTKHTHGPFAAEQDGNTVDIRAIACDGKLVAIVYRVEDANLFVAAPDLLAVCEDALLALDAFDVGTSCTSGTLRAAIAKARGGT